MGREQEVLLAVVFPMAVAAGVKNLAATRELRAGLCTVKPMGVAGDVNSLGVQRAQKDVLISVLPMVVGGDVAMRVVLELPEGNPDCASGTVVARDVRKKTAQRVLKVSQVFASHMEVVVDAKP